MLKTRPDTRPIPVADGWAGAELCVFALSQLDHHDQRTDRRTKPLIESLEFQGERWENGQCERDMNKWKMAKYGREKGIFTI